MKTSDSPLATNLIIRVWLLVVWSALFTVASACQPQTASGTEQNPKAVSSVVADSVAARQTVIGFLSWYKNHLQAANQFPLVNQAAGKPYSVNLKNGERYLTYLKSSHLLTDTYLNQWRTYFKERNANFRQHPQDEGPPDGFENDLVMLTQDVDNQLASLKRLKINHIGIAKNRATVILTLLGSYEFRLIRQNNRWLINEILNTDAD